MGLNKSKGSQQQFSNTWALLPSAWCQGIAHRHGCHILINMSHHHLHLPAVGGESRCWVGAIANSALPDEGSGVRWLEASGLLILLLLLLLQDECAAAACRDSLLRCSFRAAAGRACSGAGVGEGRSVLLLCCRRRC